MVKATQATQEKATKPVLDAAEVDVLRQLEALDYDSGSYYDDAVSLLSECMTQYAAAHGMELLMQPWAPSGSTTGIEITDFFVATPGGGNGTMVMQRFERLANAAFQGIYLRPSSDRNREFYARFGFTKDRRNHGFMFRPCAMDDEDFEEHFLGPQRSQVAKPDSWLCQTWAVNEQKEPIQVYRGQHGSAPVQPNAAGLQTILASITFTSDPAVASTYAMQPNNWRLTPVAPCVLPAYLDIRKPVFWLKDDPFVDFSVLSLALGADASLRFARKFSDHVENTNFWANELSPLFKSVDDFLNKHPERVNELYVQAWALLDDFSFVQTAREAGFDGAMSLGSGESAMVAEYRIFNPDQYKPALQWRAAVEKRIDLLEQFHRENQEAEASAAELEFQSNRLFFEVDSTFDTENCMQQG